MLKTLSLIFISLNASNLLANDLKSDDKIFNSVSNKK
jgi:hypothetical protein